MINYNIIKFTRLLLIIAVVFSGISCEKYLDQKPDSKVTTPSSVMDLQALLDHSTTMNSRTPWFDEVSSDDYFIPLANFNALGDGGRAAYLWQPFIRNNETGWRNLYQAIYFANVCLENADKIRRTPSNNISLNNIIGSAYFFRAYHLLKLVSTYCKAYDAQSAPTDLGLVLRLGSDFNVPSQRSTLAQSYKQIIDDFEKALTFLPYKSESLLRPSLAAAHAGLARTYLFMRTYEKANFHASEALKIQNSLIDYNSINLNVSFPFQKLNSEVIFHSEVSVFSFLSFPNSALVDTNLYKSYSKDDLRKTLFFANSGKYFRFKGSYSGSNSLFNGLTTSELYFIKSECLVRDGQIQEATDMINSLLFKRWNKGTSYVNFQTNDKTKALQWILEERRKELVYRGLRWMDIKRLNKENFNISIKRVVDSKEFFLLANSDKFALPFPTDIVEITGVEQNFGW